MRYIRLHISTILEQYDGGLPLTHYLKQYFRQHPKLGGRDRKLISEMVYSYYRSAKGISGPELSPDTKTDIALLLHDSSNRHAIALADQRWKDYFGQSLEQRLAAITAAGFHFDPELLLPAGIDFAEGISREEWLASMNRQPALFLRLQPAHVRSVYRRLQAAEIPYTVCNERCISLANGAAADQVLDPHSYRVQDLSSQATADWFGAKPGDECWDCCSGAGGKSLLISEQQPKARLTVSDIRPAILENLTERFKRYQYPLPRRIVLSAADRQQTAQKLGGKLFDHIVCDVPCSGSGTWARTPEQLYFFDPATLAEFAERQLQIAANVMRYLKPGGTMIYITCSVFAAENEDVVNQLLQQYPDCNLQDMQLINGIAHAADSMFVAVFKKAAVV